MKVGDLVRCKFVSPEEGNIYIVEEMIDYGKDGRGSTCTLLGMPLRRRDERPQVFHVDSLEVVCAA